MCAADHVLPSGQANPGGGPLVTRRQFLAAGGAILAAAAGCRFRLPGPLESPEGSGGVRPFRVALLSDTHIQDPVAAISAPAVNGKVARALADLKPLRPDLWLFNGDITDHGLPGEYAACRRLLGAAVRPEQMLVGCGNHEFYDKGATDAEAIRRFTESFGLTRPYSHRTVGRFHFVMLGDEQWKTAPRNPDWAWLSAEQLRWFEAVLDEQPDKLTVVALHQPLQDTVLWTGGGNGFAGTGQIAELQAIMARRPQIRLWLSGHTHLRAEAPGQTVVRDGITYACLGSTFYQSLPAAGGGYRHDMSASQSRVLDLWADRAVLRIRDHAAGKWLDEHVIT